MVRALYAGTFDPPTNGHIDVIKKAAAIFDELIVAVARNAAKTPMFSEDERAEMLREIIRDCGLRNVSVHTFSKVFTVNYAAKHGATVLVRGLRDTMDFTQEMSLMLANRMIRDDVQTVFIPTTNLAEVSSSLVKGMVDNDPDWQASVSKYVPAAVMDRFLQTNPATPTAKDDHTHLIPETIPIGDPPFLVEQAFLGKLVASLNWTIPFLKEVKQDFCSNEFMIDLGYQTFSPYAGLVHFALTKHPDFFAGDFYLLHNAPEYVGEDFVIPMRNEHYTRSGPFLTAAFEVAVANLKVLYASDRIRHQIKGALEYKGNDRRTEERRQLLKRFELSIDLTMRQVQDIPRDHAFFH